MRNLWLLLLCLPLVLQAAVTRTVDEMHINTSSHSNPSFEVTVPAGTDFLLICVTTRADVDPSAVAWNASESGTEIYADTSSSTGDAGLRVYGIVNPTATTANVSVTVPNNTQATYTAIGYAGVVTSSVEDASNVVDSTENTGATTSTVLDSGGASGNALVICASHQSLTASPATNDGGFTEIYDTTTGGDIPTSDHSVYIAELLDGAPSGATISWGASDENIGALIELIAASEGSSIAPLAHRYYEQVRQ